MKVVGFFKVSLDGYYQIFRFIERIKTFANDGEE